MNWGKVAVLALGGSMLAAAVGIYWTQTRQYWRADPAAQIWVTGLEGARLPLELSTLEAIRSESSPLGFRACFTTKGALDAAPYLPVSRPEPTVPPPWFDCFEPRAIAEALASGGAVAVLGQANIAYGVDRVIALFPDGRGYAWHELNNCGRKAYDGSPVGEACPDRATFEGAF